MFLAAAILIPYLDAQTFTGGIVGTARDPSGNVVPGAELIARNEATNASRTAISGDTGEFSFTQLVPGTYTVEASMTGFSRSVAKGIVVQVGTTTTINLRLEIGEITNAIEVSAASEVVQSDEVELGQVLDDKIIQELPLNGRNFIQLATLSPGVIPIGSNPSPLTSWTGRTDLGIIVSGLRETDTSYLLDGIETREPRWGGTSFRPSVDAIAEFKVQRNAFTADQGFGTAVVNTVVRSGTNKFHGAVFEYHRNGVMDARNFFDPAKKPPYKQNQFGVAVGGPIKKDKIFYFFNYEGYRSRLSSTSRGIVPTPEAMSGQFSKAITDPLTGQPFPGNRIPDNRIDPIIKTVRTYFPAPNLTGDPVYNYIRELSRANDSDQIHAKVDFTLSEKNNLSARFSWVDDDLLQPSLFEGYGLVRPLNSTNVSLMDTHVFGPSLVNEFRIGYNRSIDNSLPEGAFGEDGTSKIGLKNVTNKPANFVKLPGFSLAGLTGIGQGSSAALFTVDNLYVVNENLTYKKGRHTLKVGTALRPNHLSFSGDFPSNPVFQFDSRYTGDAVGDFLLGLFYYNLNFIGDSSANLHGTDMAFYLQDDWKITPKLNLYFGLRHEYFMPREEENGKFSYLDLNTLQFVQQNPLFEPDRNNFAPRVGFAYSPAEKTAIRAGVGVYYDLIASNETQFWGLLTPPNSQVTSFNNTFPVPQYRVDGMFPDPQFAPTSAPNITDPKNRIPYVYQYNLNIQREYKGILVEAGYVGSTGHKLNRRVNVNLAYPEPGVPIQERVPFPKYTTVLGSLNNGWSNYNGFNLRVEKTFSHDLYLLTAYTLGKVLDIGGPDEYVHGDRTGKIEEAVGPAFSDNRHRLSTSWIYQLPFGKDDTGATGNKVVSAIVRDWELSGVLTLQSGRYTSVTVSGDRAQIGERRLQPAIRLGEGNDPDLRSNIRDTANLSPYFRTEDFVLPDMGTMGNGGRGILLMPGANNWDVSLSRFFPITEEKKVQFRAEFFNAFNHAQFAGLGTSVNAAGFGRITSARTPRDIQFGLKFMW